MSSDAEQIKDALPIEEVVASYVKLETSGKYLKAKCPFHNERTPSFVVTPERQRFHCFGCGKGGDVFSFVQDIEGVEFYDALQLLAERAGITLTGKDSGQGGDTMKRYRLIMEKAQAWFEVQLRKDEQVVAYLKERGLTKDTMVQFHIGYAPSGWDGLHAYLQGKGFTDEEIQAVGLCTKGKRGMIDQFRERIMFPIADTQGRTIAFTGRIFIRPEEQEDPPEYKVNTGKYINSPESPLFSKSKVLYGYYQAKEAMRTAKRVVVVEGQLDCIASVQAGVEETVAISGTALTAEQVKLLLRFAHKIVLGFDMDKAGLAAMYKSALLGYEHGAAMYAIGLSKGADPASFIQEHSADAWKERVDEAYPYIQYLIKILRAGRHETKAIARIQKKVFPLIARLPLQAEQDQSLRVLADMIGVSYESLERDFANMIDIEMTDHTEQGDQQKPSVTQQGSRQDQLIAELLGIIWWEESRGDIDEPRKSLSAFLKEQLGDIYETYIVLFEEERNRLVFQAEMRYDTMSNDRYAVVLENMKDELLQSRLEQELEEVRRDLHTAEQQADEAASTALLKRYQKLSQRLQDIS